MDVILCLDDRNGMLFNHRRQSRDRKVVEDILQGLGGRLLRVRPMSQSLFPREAVLVEEELLKTAGPGDVCFVEDLPLAPCRKDIESLTVYRWNRHYPGDVFLDLDLSTGWRLVSREEFPGHSHEKITKEVYLP